MIPTRRAIHTSGLCALVVRCGCNIRWKVEILASGVVIRPYVWAEWKVPCSTLECCWNSLTADIPGQSKWRWWSTFDWQTSSMKATQASQVPRPAADGRKTTVSRNRYQIRYGPPREGFRRKAQNIPFSFVTNNLRGGFIHVGFVNMTLVGCLDTQH